MWRLQGCASQPEHREPVLSCFGDTLQVGSQELVSFCHSASAYAAGRKLQICSAAGGSGSMVSAACFPRAVGWNRVVLPWAAESQLWSQGQEACLERVSTFGAAQELANAVSASVCALQLFNNLQPSAVAGCHKSVPCAFSQQEGWS